MRSVRPTEESAKNSFTGSQEITCSQSRCTIWWRLFDVYLWGDTVWRCTYIWYPSIAQLRIKYSKTHFVRSPSKIGPYGPELIWHFGTKLAKSAKLSLTGPCICQNTFGLREVRSAWIFKKNAHKSQKISYSGIISFVYVGKEEIWSLYDCLCGQDKKSKEKYQNGCHLKTTGQNQQIFAVQIWGAYVHMCTKCEVSMSSPLPGGGVRRWQCQCRMMPMTMQDGQSMIV